MLDLIGIGALNIDFFVKRKGLGRALQVDLDGVLENHSERFVEMQVVDSYIQNIGIDNCRTQLGGSAYNATRTVASLDLGLNVGFVGCAGTTIHGISVPESFKKQSIDDSFCFYSSESFGKCLAVQNKNDRKLLTAEGCNSQLKDRLISHLGYSPEEQINLEFVEYLSNARWIHISSFKDREITKFLVSHLALVRLKNTGVQISFDPGDDYTNNQSMEILNLAKMADYIFFSWPEFKNFSNTEGADIHVRSTSIFKTLNRNTQVLVLKGKSSNYSIVNGTPKGTFIKRYWHKRIPSFFVKDDVGAGDIFAGGVIAGSLTKKFEEYGRGPIKLGASLVNERLKSSKGDVYKKFPDIASKQLEKSYKYEKWNLRNFASLYAPPIFRILITIFISILVGVISTLIVQHYFENTSPQESHEVKKT